MDTDWLDPEAGHWIALALKRARNIPDAARRVVNFWGRVPQIVKDIRSQEHRPSWLTSIIFDANEIVGNDYDVVVEDAGVVAAVDGLPWNIRRSVTNSPTALGALMENTLWGQAPLASHLARTTSLTTRHFLTAPSVEGFEDFGRALLMLRGFLFGAVAPGRGRCEWLAAWSQEECNAAIVALEEGAKAWNEHLDLYREAEACRQVAGDPDFATADLVGWLREAHRKAAAIKERL